MVSEEIARSHDRIFNIINSDDIITDMPLDFLEFRHYGQDIPISVAENYSDEWKSYTGKSYVSNQEKKEELVKSFETLAEDRNDCYTFHCDCHCGGVEVKYGTSMLVWGSEKKKDIVPYGEPYQRFRFDGDNRFQYYRECQTTAYFMQYLATLAAKADISTAMIDVAKRYEYTKWKFIGYAVDIQILWMHPATDYISNPHQPISYYILASR